MLFHNIQENVSGFKAEAEKMNFENSQSPWSLNLHCIPFETFPEEE